ncbi:peptidase M48 Ste24p [Pedosphaera parvula Ellin514]|uniref:Peptidase M48 Ste24p n=2 Tax=Pedosphaera TaxID=1032526 RepID=B9XCN3_PEDPL|nr:peptidase M48 Ste24p [Pedosphaera parvula Ellin514]
MVDQNCQVAPDCYDAAHEGEPMTQLLWQIPALFLGAFALAFATNWLSLIPWRRTGSAHWTERARLLWPARVSATSNTLVIPAVLYLTLKLCYPQAAGAWFLLVVAALLGAILGTLSMNREIFAGYDSRRLLQHLAAFWVLHLGIWLFFLGGVALMPEEFGWVTLPIIIIILAFHFFWQYGLNLKFLRLVKLLKPATPRLVQIVQQTSSKMRVQVKEVWMLEGPMAQAYAFPTTNVLLFSNRLLELCDDAEVSSICAHELGHLTESKTTLAGRLLGSLAIFPWLLIKPAMNYLGFFGLVLIAVLMFVVLRFSRSLSLRMEKRADQIAKENELDDGAYAQALEKVYRENLLPAVNPTNKQTHPHLYDRLLAAGVTPDYPRPKAPAKQTRMGMVMAMGVGFLVAANFILPSLHGGKPLIANAPTSYTNSPPLQNPDPQPIRLLSF